MRLVWKFVFVTSLMAVVSMATPFVSNSAEPPIHYGKRLPQRSARSILSRMATGFGKRGSTRDNDVTITVEDLTALMYKSPAVAEAIVRTFVDANDDGLINESEIFSSKGRKHDW